MTPILMHGDPPPPPHPPTPTHYPHVLVGCFNKSVASITNLLPQLEKWGKKMIGSLVLGNQPQKIGQIGISQKSHTLGTPKLGFRKPVQKNWKTKVM